MQPPPVLLAITLCEIIIVEEKTKNVTLVNSFSHVLMEEFPVHYEFVVHAVLTEGHGSAIIKVVIHRLDEDTIVYEHQGRLDFNNPLAEYRLRVHVKDCEFPAPGKYQVSLFADDEPLGRKLFRLTVKGEA